MTIERSGAPLATLVAPSYYEVVDAGWSPGDALGVSAPGADVGAFAGTLHAPAMVSTVTPAIGSTPLALVRATGFEIAWAPEGMPGETMQLQIDQIQQGSLAAILCNVPDSAGSVVVDASLLAPLMPGVAASAYLVRTTTSTASASNATIVLEGSLWLSGPATVE